MTPEQKRFVLYFVKQLHNCIEDRARIQKSRDAMEKCTDNGWQQSAALPVITAPRKAPPNDYQQAEARQRDRSVT